jgi:hypothetical protein
VAKLPSRLCEPSGRVTPVFPAPDLPPPPPLPAIASPATVTAKIAANANTTKFFFITVFLLFIHCSALFIESRLARSKSRFVPKE